MKTCASCGEPKPLAEFWRNDKHSDGLQGWCKDCFRRRHGGRAATWLWRDGHYPNVVQVRTEDELRMALHDPYPFYAEPRR